MTKRIIRYPRALLTISIVLFSGFLIATCTNDEGGGKPLLQNASGASFAGSASCEGCHKNIYEHHVHTAHFLTSRMASREYIKGSFDTGLNSFLFSPAVKVNMEHRKNGFYQVEYEDGKEVRSGRIDIVVGSGTMGQSYLYWRDHKLFQLPITFFSAANAWSNSPGFPDKVVFNRIITSRCLECHTTYAVKTSGEEQEAETFDKNRIIYGVDCEKCHGPAARHVAFQTEHPNEKRAQYIVNPATLSRQQNLDLCASCHGGRLQKTKPSFTFSVGDKLSDFFVVDTAAPVPDQIDVHGNQYGLLRASKCFRMSQTLTCSSCHNVHQNEKGSLAVFSQRCMNCHNGGHGKTCKLTVSLGQVIQSNCIDCHMPLQASHAIAVHLQEREEPVAALIRSHFIKIYPEETKKILVKLKEHSYQR
ncbi:MAG: multiheme c-type cytochrome [Flavisolibacter sp.]